MLSFVLQFPGVPARVKSRPGNPTAHIPPPSICHDTQPELSWAENRATWQTRSGLYPFDQVVENVAEALKDEEGDNSPVPEDLQRRRPPPDLPFREWVVLERARRIVRPIWDDQLRRQDSWPDVTDVDRLARAFSSLERNHAIIARMNVACCVTCSRSDLSEYYRDGDRGRETAGYVFFHEQDAQRMVEPPRSPEEQTYLDLHFGSFTKSPTKTWRVGKKIVGSLRAAGLHVRWSGDVNRAIEVDPIMWRKRVSEVEESEPDDESDEDYRP